MLFCIFLTLNKQELSNYQIIKLTNKRTSELLSKKFHICFTLMMSCKHLTDAVLTAVTGSLMAILRIKEGISLTLRIFASHENPTTVKQLRCVKSQPLLKMGFNVKYMKYLNLLFIDY